MGLWGPKDVGGRNGFHYMFGAVCRSTGKVFLQQLKKKSEAKIAIAKFLALIRREFPLIQIHLRRWGKSFRLGGMAVVSTGCGGEFTCTNGYTESQVDVLLRDVVHLFNTPGYRRAEPRGPSACVGRGRRYPLLRMH